MPESVDSQPSENMNKSELGQTVNPESSKKPVSELSFIDALKERERLLSRLRKTTEEEEKRKINDVISEVRGRIQGLVQDLQDEGAFKPFTDVLQDLEAKKREGRLTAEDIREERRQARDLDKEWGLSEDDPHYGVIRWYAEERLNLLRNSLTQTPVEESPTSRSPDNQLAEKLDQIIRIEERSLSRQDQFQAETIEMQREQYEAFRVTGYSGLVSAESAQAGLNVQLFDTQPPVWYDRLPERWKNVIRTRLGILLGSYIKREAAHLSLDDYTDRRDIRVNKEALITMWNHMPGFRIAMATMFNDFFLLSNTGSLYVDKKGLEELTNFDDYKEKFVDKLTKYFKENPELLTPENTMGGPDSSPEVSALAAFSVAWNLIFVGNAPDSGDVGRHIRNGNVYAEQIRAFFRPQDKGRGKWLTGKEDFGTDESWGGNLGDWYAERIRHDLKFRKKFEEGKINFMPKRMFFSLFDLTNVGEGDKKRRETPPTLAQTLVLSRKKEIEPGSGLFDYVNPEDVGLSKIGSGELWPGYGDLMDSAKRIYYIIQSKAKNPTVQELATALSKLRTGRSKLLSDVYSDIELLEGAVIGMMQGPANYSSDILLNISYEHYDLILTQVLGDDRLYATMEMPVKKAREKAFKDLNGVNLNNPNNLGKHMRMDKYFGRREIIRRRIKRNRKRFGM